MNGGWPVICVNRLPLSNSCLRDEIAKDRGIINSGSKSAIFFPPTVVTDMQTPEGS